MIDEIVSSVRLQCGVSCDVTKLPEGTPGGKSSLRKDSAIAPPKVHRKLTDIVNQRPWLDSGVLWGRRSKQNRHAASTPGAFNVRVVNCVPTMVYALVQY